MRPLIQLWREQASSQKMAEVLHDHWLGHQQNTPFNTTLKEVGVSNLAVPVILIFDNHGCWATEISGS